MGVSVLADAHRARAAGAKVVIVNVHWGDENVAEPSSFSWRARRLTRAPDITAIVGQHENVVQPIRTINGSLSCSAKGT
ncbi:MAG: CapA family protein [Solirubrobacteraceae bacterium]